MTRFLSLAVLMATVTLANESGVSAQQAGTGQDRYFSGVYLGANLGSQNIFGGALINQIDVLTQDRAAVIVFAGGVRGQLFGDHLLLGVEFQYGLTNGNLSYFDPPSQSDVSYENNSQTGFGFTLGWAGGPENKVAIFSYALATDRSFEIDIVDPVNSYSQTDGQGFLQYGVVVEVSAFGPWHIRGSVGTQYTDYGDLVTNIGLARDPDLMIGAAYQF